MKRLLFSAAALIVGATAWLPAQAHVQHGVHVAVHQPVQRSQVWVPGHWVGNGHHRVWRQGHWQSARHRHPHYPAVAYRRHGDQDRDGVPNHVDRDRDGDGVANRFDRNPYNSRRH